MKKTLAKLTMRKRENLNDKVGNGSGDSTTNQTVKKQKIIKRKYYEQFHIKWDKLDETDKFLETQNWLKNIKGNTQEVKRLNQKLNTSQKSQGPEGFTGKFNQMFEKSTSFLIKLLKTKKIRDDF